MTSAADLITNIAEEIIRDFRKTRFKDRDEAIEDYRKDCDNFSELPEEFLFSENKSNAHKELAKKLKEGYEKKLSSDIKKQFKKEFFSGVEKRCPFCGQLLESSGKSDSDVPTADLDHFFPKSKYPQFSLLPKNLIPTCMECNRIEKLRSSITPTEFKDALKELNLLTKFKEHPKSHFKLYNSLSIDFNNKEIIQTQSDEVKKLIDLYGLERRYQNIKNKSYNILFNILRHSGIRSPESLERALGNMASSNWHELNDGYSLNNSPQIWQEFIEDILYDECKC